jgi:hypothetical protein
MMKIVKLDMEHVNKGTPTHELPVTFKGNKKQCEGILKRHEFIKDSNLYGGYWNDEEGNSYFIIPA